MRKIWELKKKMAEKERLSGGVNASQIRIQKDVTELELPSTMKAEWPNPADLSDLVLYIAPDEGFYKGGVFKFSVKIGANYPHEPPKVKCLNKIYHPNIDTSGNVCLNILRQEWNPVLNLNSVFVGLQFLFLAPNPDDPLNKDAAFDLKSTPADFAHRVSSSMNGGRIGGAVYDNVLTH
ncbi:NEDD8-conjugating enzyme Ubc12 [Schizosaccharomyces japonicus yFS275]|uniref:NEDD8-conjugating enzyme UBC12 n=1 Tax=Schizosaccharomyces japonicus (strain yFS275 / FY16936) TaxID=402676 RepID=B6JX93_SCHJY|nr:NEDD8-conjugating enzyme Ubc12 [Schizosaccharomyces japonicus yFS275]EEB05994.1 NEDD8-conjugating enzyme Ubc12 [Schizosaccharomyces japonicus yFS275]